MAGTKTREITIVDKAGTFNTFFKRFSGEQEEYDFEGYAKEGRSIVSEFFCLNQDSDIPSKFLKFFIL